MKRLSLGFALALAVLGVFSGCGKSKEVTEITVLIRMMPAQQRFFRDKIIAEFEKKRGCTINIATFNNEWDIERILKLEVGKKQPEIALVKVPFEMTRLLVSKGYMKPLAGIIDTLQLNQDLAEYHPLAAGLGIVDGVPYYLPRKLETRVMFYRKSMVADAVEKFAKHKSRIQADLKKRNGYGLPKGYELESDPNLWDVFDIYAVGSIWANEEYNGIKMGRLAHRGARYGGTALDLVDNALRLGASHEDILKLNSEKVAETYLWENVLVADGLYNPGMWQDPWKGANIYNGIKDGKVFLSFLQQIDCFIVHGWDEDPGMSTYLPDANDMGLAVMPAGASLSVDGNGSPEIVGTRAQSTGGWWWGVPATSPNAKLAYEFARFITSKEIQAQECTRFGMIPVRKDILNNMPEVFELGWVGDIFKVSIDQINLQIGDTSLVTVPLVKQYTQLAQNMVEAWYKLCVEYDQKQLGLATRAVMKRMLGGEWVTKQKEILGPDFPR